MSIGLEVIASGKHSFAIGENVTASGLHSFATGNQSLATGDYSTAFGIAAGAATYGEFVIGSYNLESTGHAHDWNANSSEDLFVIGNGYVQSGTPIYSNAFKVAKNGDTVVYGHLTANNLSLSTLAFGANSSADSNSIAIGSSSSATGGATVFGSQSTADGNLSVAVGSGVNVTSGDVGVGRNVNVTSGYANGNNVAFGNSVGIDGYSYCTTVVGVGTSASGYYPTAVGYGSTARADGASVFGFQNSAFGNYSSALGSNTVTMSYGETVLGRYNAIDGAQTHDSWVATDNLLVVGNGSDEDHTSNALVIQKNGNATFANNVTVGQDLSVVGHLRVAAQGDISMAPFQSGPTP